tara:strand:+ start:11698 stop:12438 length:741 start_codon:yes stop_codon:yes gene_type:complete
MGDLNSYEENINQALQKKESLVFSCNCTIKYSGRAESFLGKGDRIVVVKEDGAILIHQPTGNSPINYMKPGTSHSVVFQDQKLVFSSKHLAQKEYLDMDISKIHFFNAHKLEDTESLVLAGTEKDMADMLMKDPHLIEEGFKPLNNEEHTKYGFIDIFGHDKDNNLTIVECKRYTADLSAVTQLRRYVEKIKDAKGLKEVRGMLVAPKISSNALKMLQDWGFEFKAIKAPKFLERYDKGQKKLDGF